MPSVRDLLKGGRPASNATEQQGPDLAPPPAAGDLPPELALADDPNLAIAERLRAAADQKAALAKLEIERQQQRIDQFEDRLEELTKQGLPTGEIGGQLDNAKARLGDAKEDLARAEEAKMNINPAMGTSRGEVPAHLDNDRGMGAPAEHQSVRSALGNRVQSAASAPRQGTKLK